MALPTRQDPIHWVGEVRILVNLPSGTRRSLVFGPSTALLMPMAGKSKMAAGALSGNVATIPVLIAAER